MTIETSLEKVNSALLKIREAGGSVQVEGTYGTISIKGVERRFSFNRETKRLTVLIDSKPLYVSTDRIENTIRNYFN